MMDVLVEDRNDDSIDITVRRRKKKNKKKGLK